MEVVDGPTAACRLQLIIPDRSVVDVFAFAAVGVVMEIVGAVFFDSFVAQLNIGRHLRRRGHKIV